MYSDKKGDFIQQNWQFWLYYKQDSQINDVVKNLKDLILLFLFLY